jgi:hypothetical protein
MSSNAHLRVAAHTSATRDVAPPARNMQFRPDNLTRGLHEEGAYRLGSGGYARLRRRLDGTGGERGRHLESPDRR